MPDDPILADARSVLVVDWPTRDVPDALARAGLDVMVHGGPDPDDYSAYEVVDGEVVARRVGRPPAHADLVYTHRPLTELPEVVEQALTVGAHTVWIQSGVNVDGDTDPRGCWLSEADAASARAVVESAGLAYIDHPYIADAARRLGAG